MGTLAVFMSPVSSHRLWAILGKHSLSIFLEVDQRGTCWSSQSTISPLKQMTWAAYFHGCLICSWDGHSILNTTLTSKVWWEDSNSRIAQDITQIWSDTKLLFSFYDSSGPTNASLDDYHLHTAEQYLPQIILPFTEPLIMQADCIYCLHAWKDRVMGEEEGKAKTKLLHVLYRCWSQVWLVLLVLKWWELISRLVK